MGKEMYLQETPGVWIPLSEEEHAQAEQLRDEIAHLAQTTPGGERHLDRLGRLSLLIGTAAVGAVVTETEGPQAEQRWRARQDSPWKEQMRLLGEAMRLLWRRLRGGEEPNREKAKVIALKARRGGHRPARIKS